MLNRLWLASLLALFAATSTFAQESIRLQFELYKNSSLIAAPSVAVQDNGTGTLALEGVMNVSFTPSRIDAEKIGISLDVVAGEKSFKPRIVLLNQQPGSISWNSASGSDSFELRISSLR